MQSFLIHRAMLAAVALLASLAVHAQPIKVVNVVELSGAGAPAGTGFNNGVSLAVKEINATGGILQHLIEITSLDTQSEPAVARAQAQRAVERGAFAVFGPVFSGSVMASMAETRRGEVPNFVGGEATAITLQGNPYVFRTSFSQATAMPKVARYISDRVKVRNLAVIYVDNDFGKGGLEMLNKALAGTETKLVIDLPTKSGQVDFVAAVTKVRESSADAVFVYTNEDESTHVLRELRKQGWTRPIIGESTLTNQKVIQTAGSVAEGVVAHIGLTVDAPIKAVRAFRANYEQAYKTTPDHNAMKGYSGVYVLKAAIERAGKLDRKAVAQAMKGLKLNTDRHPGVLMYTEYDNKGDLDRMSFLVEVRKGKQEVIDLLPPLSSMFLKPAAAPASPPTSITTPPKPAPASKTF